MGQVALEHPRLTSWRAALACALLVLVLGFGAMNAFWAFGTWDSPRGLYYFRSATWGDGLVLPVLAYLLVRIGQWGVRLPVWANRTVLIAGVVGVLGGALTQYQWLNDPEIITNWTIPEAGRFNEPGIYHAAFLILAAGFFAAILVRAIVATWRHRGDPASLVLPEFALVLIVIPLFPALLAIDFVDSSASPGGVVTSSLVAAAIPVVLVLLVAPRALSLAIPPLLLGGALATAVPLLIVYLTQQDSATIMQWATLAVFAPNFALSLWTPRQPGGHHLTSRAMIIALALALSSVASGIAIFEGEWQVPLLAHTLLTLGISVLILALCIRTWGALLPTRVPATYEVAANAGFLVTVAAFGAWVGANTDNAASEALFVLWSISVVSAIAFEKLLFGELVNAEHATKQAKGEGRPASEVAHATAVQDTHRVRVFSWGVMGLLTVTLAFLAGEIALNPDSGVLRAIWAPPVPIVAVVAQVLLVVLLLVIARIPTQTLRAARLVGLAVAASVIVLNCLVLGPIGVELWGHVHRWPLVITALVPGLGLIAFGILSVLGNVHRLRGKTLGWSGRALAVLSGVLISTSTLVGLSVLILAPFGFKALGLLSILCAMAMPLRLVAALTDEDLTMTLMDTKPAAGLMQDAVLSIALTCFIVGYPGYNLLVHGDLAIIVTRSVAFLGVIAAVYAWTLSNNVDHASSYRPADDVKAQELHEGVDEMLTGDEVYRRIRSHTRTQNIISAIMLLPVVPYMITSLDVEEIALGLAAGAGPAGR